MALTIFFSLYLSNNKSLDLLTLHKFQKNNWDVRITQNRMNIFDSDISGTEISLCRIRNRNISAISLKAPKLTTLSRLCRAEAIHNWYQRINEIQCAPIKSVPSASVCASVLNNSWSMYQIVFEFLLKIQFVRHDPFSCTIAFCVPKFARNLETNRWIATVESKPQTEYSMKGRIYT